MSVTRRRLWKSERTLLHQNNSTVKHTGTFGYNSSTSTSTSSPFRYGSMFVTENKKQGTSTIFNSALSHHKGSKTNKKTSTSTTTSLMHNSKNSNATSVFRRCIHVVNFLIAIIGMIIYCFLQAKGKYLILANPLLATASLCMMLSLSQSQSTSNPGARTSSTTAPKFRTIRTIYQRCSQCYYQSALNCFSSRIRCNPFRSCTRTLLNDAHSNLTFLSLLFILAPCTIYILRQFHSHLNLTHVDSTTGKLIFSLKFDASTHQHLANDLGKLSVVAMSYFLVPVSRHSILLNTLGIHASHAIRMHIWAGTIALAGGLGHGLYWLWIWVFLHLQTFENLFPHSDCWVWLWEGERDKSQGNSLVDVDFACHLRFVNLLGVICGICFIGLGCTSLWWVRRNHYRVFYVCHIVFSFILLFGLLMHYNKIVLYLAPGLLYYAALSVPVWIKALSDLVVDFGVNLSTVVHVEDSGGCVDLGIKMNQIDAHTGVSGGILETICGKYARICVPEISNVWHPFTVFATESHPDEMRILFRSYGPFTKELSRKLLPVSLSTSSPSGSSQQSRPTILMDGLYGGSNPVEEALKHDTVVIIAGGVGIATYISLIALLQQSLLSQGTRSLEHEYASDRKLKRLIVHWVSRDEGLISHVMNNYLHPSYSLESSPIEFHIHHTSTPSIDNHNHPDANVVNVHTIVNQGTPFIPSPLSAGGGKSLLNNILPTISFSCIAWGGLYIIKYCYNEIQDRHTIHTRTYSVMALIVLSIIVSVLSQIVKTILSILFKPSYSKLSATGMGGEGDNFNGDRESYSMTTEHIKDLGPRQNDFTHTDLSSESTSSNSDSFVCDTSKSDHSHRLDVDLETQVGKDQAMVAENRNEGANHISARLGVSHSQGRPNFSSIIQDIIMNNGNNNADYDEDNDVGFFMCGPTMFLQSLRKTIREVESERSCSCSSHLPSAIYEEVFEF